MIVWIAFINGHSFAAFSSLIEMGTENMATKTTSSSSTSSNKDWPQASVWRDIDARSAPFTIPSNRETSPTTNFHVQNSSSPPTSVMLGESLTSSSAQSFSRFTSPPPQGQGGEARSPSPSKRGPFPFGNPSDSRDRWTSIGQAQQQQGFNASNDASLNYGGTSSQNQNHLQSQQQRKNMSSGMFGGHEPFLGYNDIWGSGGQRSTDSELRVQSTTGQSKNSGGSSLDPIHTRFESMGLGRDDGSGYSSNLASNPSQASKAINIGGGQQFGPLSGLTPSDSLSPRSMMQFHQQQLQAQQHQQQHPSHPQQHSLHPSSIPGGSSGSQIGMNTGLEGPRNGEEITTVFIVGFPDDMTEREFANMFLFAKGFEASTLKIPAGMNSTPLRPGENVSTGAGGPYNAVNVTGSNLFDMQSSNGGAGSSVGGSSWDEQSISLGLSRHGSGPDSFGSMSTIAAGAGDRNSMGGLQGGIMGPPGKIKQIIGFAKFRTRAEALEARDALNGRKIDAERGCVLKTEMAKKNLHTKQRPVLANASGQEGQPSFPPPPGSGGMGPPHGFSQSNMTVPQGPPPSNGPLGSAPGSLPPNGPGFNPSSNGMQDTTGGPVPPGFGAQMQGPRTIRPEMGATHPNAPVQNAMGLPSAFMNSYNGAHSNVPFSAALNSQAGTQPPFDHFNGQNAGGQHGGPGGMLPASEQGGNFYAGRRQYIGSAQQSEGDTFGSRGGNEKWTGSGPLDYFDANGSAQNGQQNQQQHQGRQQSLSVSSQNPPFSANGNMSNNITQRGTDWGAISSPNGTYPSATAKPITFGQIPSQIPSLSNNQQIQHEQQSSTQSEDFKQGESTTFKVQKEQEEQSQRLHQSSMSPITSPQGSEKKNEAESTINNRGALQSQMSSFASQLNGIDAEATHVQRLQNTVSPPPMAAPIAAHAGQTSIMSTILPSGSNQVGNGNSTTIATSSSSQGVNRPHSRLSNRATSPSISVSSGGPGSRFGSLRIDSPMNNQRPFSPHTLMRSPPPFLDTASLHFRATSPGSPPISSPTSRSFSIDANPPGNTLFVGNLPASITSPPASIQLEDSLYKVFSAKNGFRQMSFRVKNSGPMCFIEFDDVGCAGRALGELNGDTLEGKVKGGLRLSFSKHPLFKGTSSASSHGGTQTPISGNHHNSTISGQSSGPGNGLPNNEQIINAVRAA